ncbi:TetR/AcrR family transcriptional regulator [Candidatus Leptofilum sp.]|uniref:TetR/AcrR family transcriptional regulator n=1 Tax=Candidatus Leptofilum sp. TaxID=3241576 RepID=UPI003B5C56F7
MARDLTKEKVVQKAVELANQLGDVHQLKLKDLAAALNIKVPSLYNHIEGTDGLVYALRVHALLVLDEQLRDAMAGKIGSEALWAAAQCYRTFAHANPGIYQLVIPAGAADSEIERLGWNTISLMLLVLGSFGLEGEEALHVVRGFRSLLHGFVSLELAGGFGLDLDLDESFYRFFKAYLDGLNMT